MTSARRARLALALIAGVLLTTLVAVPADARLPRARHYRPGGHLTLDTNLLSPSGTSAWAIDGYLAAHTSLPPLGAAFMAAERTYRVNARFLLAAALHESGWGRGYIARVKHNLFGYNAYDRDPVRYANAYRSYAANIDDTARFIRDAYLTPGGRWWGGRPTLRSMQRFWSSSGQWGVEVGRIASSLRLETLRRRGIGFAKPVVSGPVHAGASMLVGIRCSGGPLPASIGFAATWVPVELDADVAAAEAVTPPFTAGLPPADDAAIATSAGAGPARPSTAANPAPSGDIVVAARRVRGGAHAVTLTLPVPAAPGRYLLRLDLRDAGGGTLPAADRVPVAAVEVRAWADRAVDYAIAVGPDGAGAVVRITNTGRVAIPATGEPAGDPQNPEIETPRSVITVTTDGADPSAGTPSVLAMTPLRADLAPGASTTVALLDDATGDVVIGVSVLGDDAWLGATSTGRLTLGPREAASTPPAPIATPTPAPTPGPAATPQPTPTPPPSPRSAPTPAPQPITPPVRHVTRTVTERNPAIGYRGRWADALSAGYLGGHVAWSSTPGATATLTFTGTSVAWIGPVGPTRGRALVLVDGRPVARISLWRSSFAPRAVLFQRSFATSGRHRLTIEVLPAPGRGIVAVDGFRVRS